MKAQDFVQGNFQCLNICFIQSSTFIIRNPKSFANKSNFISASILCHTLPSFHFLISFNKLIWNFYDDCLNKNQLKTLRLEYCFMIFMCESRLTKYPLPPPKVLLVVNV